MNTEQLDAVALSIRSLSMDAVEKANSGHPGLPMGMAELGALLYGKVLRYHHADPAWLNRDRFVLSAGHGSMFIYSLLHLAGFDLPLEELKRFRQLGSMTPGHPEYGHAPGIETTTGPLGQGLANAVGMALAERMAAARLNIPGHEIINYHSYFLAGDGCMMEGISSEAASLAGHLKLGKLIGIYDSNKISIEGSTSLAFTEDVGKRFEAFGWQVLHGDAYDYQGMAELIEKAKADESRPSLIILKSIIGKGSPNKAGTHGIHGAALGSAEILETRKALGLAPEQEFYRDPKALEFFKARREELKAAYEAWQKDFEAWKKAAPDKAELLETMRSRPEDLLSKVDWPKFAAGDKLATRSASGKAINALAASLPQLIGGSADLSPSNNTDIKDGGSVQAGAYDKRILHFGVREHAMGAITNGITLSGLFRPFCATFMVFTDYMRPPMRLAALMKIPSIFVMTHDSIFVGEDGPTHQPVEQIAALRVIPNLQVLRPGDAEETQAAWAMALKRQDGPSVLALTRQNLKVYEKPQDWQSQIEDGAYKVKDGGANPAITLIATGSEVNLALDAAASYEKANPGKPVQVISMICRERFSKLPAYKKETLVPKKSRRIVVEIAASQGWEGFVDDSKDLFCLDDFGVSAPGDQAAAHFGLTVQGLQKLMEN